MHALVLESQRNHNAFRCFLWKVRHTNIHYICITYTNDDEDNTLCLAECSVDEYKHTNTTTLCNRHSP